jgi:hypothetical protein
MLAGELRPAPIAFRRRAPYSCDCTCRMRGARDHNLAIRANRIDELRIELARGERRCPCCGSESAPRGVTARFKRYVAAEVKPLWARISLRTGSNDHAATSGQAYDGIGERSIGGPRRCPHGDSCLKHKEAVLARVARSATLFYPECRDNFICPTCLGRVPVSDTDRITDAHILPKAVGGGLLTLLCKTCNNTFGAHQDRWMGELLRLVKTNSTILKDGSQQGHFEIDGIRVNGRYRVREEGGLDLFVLPNKNSPPTLRILDDRFAQFRSGQKDLSVTLPLPLLANKRLVSVGFLTAAYLLWFKELGYSWALQNHLDDVRQQIRNPDAAVLSDNFNAWSTGATFKTPWIGVGKVGDETALMAGLANRIVFFPPADRPDGFYSRLPTDFSGMKIGDIRPLRFYKQHSFEGPLGVLYGDRLIVAPDVFLTQRSDAPLLFIPPDGGPAHLLHTPTPEQVDNMSKETPILRIQASRVVEPHRETGRP